MAQQQQQSGSDDGFQVMIIGAIVFLLIGSLLWLAGHAQIAKVMVGLRDLEMRALSPFFPEAQTIHQFLIGINPATLTFSAFRTIARGTGEISRWVFAPAIVVTGIALYWWSPKERFIRSHTMESLLTQEKHLWPEIACVDGLGKALVKNAFDNSWAVAMTEREFVNKHRLLDDTGKLLEDKTARVFTAQLGPLWAGVQRLPPHTRAIFAALATKVAGKEKEALSYFRILAKSMAEGKPDYSWVDNALIKHGSHALVLKAISRHAYVTTVMATLLQISRVRGVMQSAMIIWLKPVDRRLWYTLNAVGRYAFFVESGGPMAHWLAEKEIGMRITTPMMKYAVEGLKYALTEYCDDDSSERIFK